MADNRHLENLLKLPYLSNGFTDSHEIWHNAFRIFTNFKTADGTILKVEKLP